MLALEILHTDIAQMAVDRIVCPIHMDLTPAYEAGRQIFFAAGYDQLQKAISAAAKAPSQITTCTLPLSAMTSMR